MLESLSNRLQGVFKSLRGEARLTEATVDAALREIRLALLEADVNFKVVKAFVVSNRPYSEPLVKEIQDFTREKLSAHEFPRLVEFVDELPKTVTGKILRRELRDR